jgi:hypothetical protein
MATKDQYVNISRYRKFILITTDAQKMLVIRNRHNTIRATVRGYRTGHDNVDNRVTRKPVLKNMQSLKVVELTEGISNKMRRATELRA